MNRQNLFYPNYYNNYGYKNYMSNRYNPTFFNATKPFKNTNESEIAKDSNTKNENIQNIDTENETQNLSNEENQNRNLKFGPINISDNTIHIFGISIQIDDLIIIALIILLLLESDTDYTLIIILGLLLFNISFSSLHIFT